MNKLRKRFLPLTALWLLWSTGLAVPSEAHPATRQLRSPEPAVSRPSAELSAQIVALRSALSSGSIGSAIASVVGTPEVPQSGLSGPAAIGSHLAAVPRSVRPAIADLEQAVNSARAALSQTGRTALTSRLEASRIAEALDRALPALRSQALSGTGSKTVPGCDLVDQVPVLCVGSEAANIYTEDVALLVDLGGDDRYENSAGGAPFALEGLQPVRVSVNLDLGGNDTYSGVAKGHLCGGVVAQGSACLSAIGFLIDTAGDDRYIATLDSTQGPNQGVDTVQGSGFGDGATGALIDFAGNDHYSVEEADGPDEFRLLAQGSAYAVGSGLLLDSGEGDDTYEVNGGALLLGGQSPNNQARTLTVQGAGRTLGWGILSDGGGRDAFSVEGRVSNEQLNEDDSRFGSWPDFIVEAQGAGTSDSLGALLTGVGDTTYSVDVQSDGKAGAWATAQGAAKTESTGALDDLGGHDEYRLSVVETLHRDIVVDDGCTTGPGKPCERAQATIYAPPGTRLLGQGTGITQSIGQLHDHAGNDSYTTISTNEVRVELRDRLSDPVGGPVLRVEGFMSTVARAQAAGVSGAGVLIDDSGTDRYSLNISNTAFGAATSDHSSDTPVVTARVQEQGGVGGQGAMGNGTLFLDRGGVGDTVTSVGDFSAETVPSGGAFVEQISWPLVQGGGMEARFLVLGTNPSVHSSPSRPACPGSMYRGYQTWADCPVPPGGTAEGDPDHEAYDPPSEIRASVGHVPNAPFAARPSLTLTPDTAQTAPVDYNDDPTPSVVRIPAGASLLDASGAPLAGERIHFALQLWVEEGGYWRIHEQIEALTDEHGIARALVPALGTHGGEVYPWRISATYDGRPGIFYPRHVASPLTLTP